MPCVRVCNENCFNWSIVNKSTTTITKISCYDFRARMSSARNELHWKWGRNNTEILPVSRNNLLYIFFYWDLRASGIFCSAGRRCGECECENELERVARRPDGQIEFASDAVWRRLVQVRSRNSIIFSSCQYSCADLAYTHFFVNSISWRLRENPSQFPVREPFAIPAIISYELVFSWIEKKCNLPI